MEAQIPPYSSVRGKIKHYLLANSHFLVEPVLEIGSRMDHPDAWWANNRDLRPDLKWIGVDMQPGFGVDEIQDCEHLTYKDRSFGSVICSEVLEHSYNPKEMIKEAFRVVMPGGCLLVTTLFSFHVHAYPDDYFRYTESCLQRMFQEAGFIHIETETAGHVKYILNDHGERDQVCPLYQHVFCKGIRPPEL